jgi:hypothetical protein
VVLFGESLISSSCYFSVLYHHSRSRFSFNTSRNNSNKKRMNNKHRPWSNFFFRWRIASVLTHRLVSLRSSDASSLIKVIRDVREWTANIIAVEIFTQNRIIISTEALSGKIISSEACGKTQLQARFDDGGEMRCTQIDVHLTPSQRD